LPEAQLDCFLLRIDLGYPVREEEPAILDRFIKNDPLEDLAAATSPGHIHELQPLRVEIRVSMPVREYIADLIGAMRSHPKVLYGASPRGSLGLMKAAQAAALLRGRDFVIPDDVKDLAPLVLTHRMILRHEERAKGAFAHTVLALPGPCFCW